MKDIYGKEIVGIVENKHQYDIPTLDGDEKVFVYVLITEKGYNSGLSIQMSQEHAHTFAKINNLKYYTAEDRRGIFDSVVSQPWPEEA